VVAAPAVGDEDDDLARHRRRQDRQRPPRPRGRDVRQPVDPRELAQRDPEDHEQREPVNLQVAQRRLVRGDVPEELLLCRRRHRGVRVPQVQPRLGDEPEQGREDEADVRLEPDERPAVGRDDLPGEDEHRRHLQRSAGHRRGKRHRPPAAESHPGGADHQANNHRDERCYGEARGGEVGVPQSREGLVGEAHDEQAHPAVDLGVAVGVDVVEACAFELPGDADLPQQPRTPGGAGGEDQDDARDEEPAVDGVGQRGPIIVSPGA
jgi:hypothetical protein